METQSYNDRINQYDDSVPQSELRPVKITKEIDAVEPKPVDENLEEYEDSSPSDDTRPVKITKETSVVEKLRDKALDSFSILRFSQFFNRKTLKKYLLIFVVIALPFFLMGLWKGSSLFMPNKIMGAVMHTAKDTIGDKMGDLGTKAKDYIVDKKDDLVDNLGDAGTYMKEKFGEATDKMGDLGTRAKDFIVDKKDDMKDSIKDTTKSAKRSIDRTTDKIEDLGTRAKDYVVDKKNDMKKSTKDTTKSAKRTLDRTTNSVGDLGSRAKDFVVEKVEQVKETLGDATEKMGDLGTRAKDFIVDKKDDLMDSIKDTGKSAKKTVERTTDKMGDLGSKVKDYVVEKKDDLVDNLGEAKTEMKETLEEASGKVGDFGTRAKVYMTDKKDDLVDNLGEAGTEMKETIGKATEKISDLGSRAKDYIANKKDNLMKDIGVGVDSSCDWKESTGEYINKTTASIVFKYPLTSPTYSKSKIKNLLMKVFSFALGGKDMMNYPANVLSDDMESGHCYSFEGTQGNITIDLKSTVTVKGVSIQHPPDDFLKCSVKRFSVYAFKAETLGQLYRDTGFEIAKDLEFPISTEKKSFYSKRPSKIDLPVGPKIFPVNERDTRYLQFRFLENNGDPDYTCVYRVNVLVDRP